MTREIYLGIAGFEHMNKQPSGRRYALFCKEALKGTFGVDCETRDKGGHIGDYAVYVEAKQSGSDHAHPVLVRFYPDIDNSRPSDDFLEELKNLPTNRKGF